MTINNIIFQNETNDDDTIMNKFYNIIQQNIDTLVNDQNLVSIFGRNNVTNNYIKNGKSYKEAFALSLLETLMMNYSINKKN